MTIALLLFAGGLSILGLIVGARWLAADAWRRRLVAHRVRLPAGLSPDQVSAWLGMVASATRSQPLGIEVLATHKGIFYFLLVPLGLEGAILGQLQSALPGVRVDEAPDYLTSQPVVRAASELRLSSTAYPLAHDRAEAAVTALLSGLYPFARGEVVRVQWIISGTRAVLPSKEDSGEVARALRAKHVAPVFNAVGRIAVSAPSPARAVSLLSRVANAFRVLDAPGVSVIRRLLPSSVVAARIYARATPLAVWPLRLNTNEAVGLLGLAVGKLHLPGLDLRSTRQLPPPEGMARHGLVLAESNFPSTAGRPLALKTADRLRHAVLLGPTGAGKSTLMINMVLSDVAAGRGVIMIDPKGDAVSDVLARVPEDRVEDVIVLDPSETSTAVLGFNPLAVPPAADEQTRELVVDQVVHVFHEIYKAFWGPRTDLVLRSALLSLVSVPAPGGSAFTLCEILTLLTSPALRRYVTTHASLPASLQGTWQWFDALSDGERQAATGPVLNKLAAFTTRSAGRLLVGQSRGIDLGEVFAHRQALLVALPKGKLGTETAHLLGSMIASTVYQTALTRAAVPAERRHPVFVYVDEAHNFVRLTTELSDALAESRGYGVGWVLAHQFLDQLPKQVEAAVFGTIRTQVTFQLDHDDARVLEKRFAPALSAADLMGLEAHHVAIRPCIDGQTRAPVTGKTLPLAEPIRDPQELATQSRRRYGTPRAEVEAALRARVETGKTAGGRFGRTRRGDPT
jgi:hypothetical protein